MKFLLAWVYRWCHQICSWLIKPLSAPVCWSISIKVKDVGDIIACSCGKLFYYRGMTKERAEAHIKHFDEIMENL